MLSLLTLHPPPTSRALVRQMTRTRRAPSRSCRRSPTPRTSSSTRTSGYVSDPSFCPPGSRPSLYSALNLAFVWRGGGGARAAGGGGGQWRIVQQEGNGGCRGGRLAGRLRDGAREGEGRMRCPILVPHFASNPAFDWHAPHISAGHIHTSTHSHAA